MSVLSPLTGGQSVATVQPAREPPSPVPHRETGAETPIALQKPTEASPAVLRSPSWAEPISKAEILFRYGQYSVKDVFHALFDPPRTEAEGQATADEGEPTGT